MLTPRHKGLEEMELQTPQADIAALSPSLEPTESVTPSENGLSDDEQPKALWTGQSLKAPQTTPDFYERDYSPVVLPPLKTMADDYKPLEITDGKMAENNTTTRTAVQGVLAADEARHAKDLLLGQTLNSQGWLRKQVGIAVSDGE